jgi:predicted phosphodiesterase
MSTGLHVLASRPNQFIKFISGATMTMIRNWFLPVLTLAVAHVANCKGGSPRPRNCKGAVRHVHLAVGPDPSTQMTVSFASKPSTVAAPAGGVFIGTSPSELTRVVMEEEVGSSYSVINVPMRSQRGHEDYHSPYYHHVTISDLTPSTTYYYRPVIHKRAETFFETQVEEALKGSQGNKTEEDNVRHQRDLSEMKCPSLGKARSFTTAPVAGPNTALTLAVMADLGHFHHSRETLTGILQSIGDIDAVILAGDIAYTEQDHYRWDTFFDLMDDFPVAENTPLHVCPGNHDIDKLQDDDGIYLAYEHRFRMPRIKPAELAVYQYHFDHHHNPDHKNINTHPPYPLPYEYGNAYYAYTHGPARMVMLNAYSSMEPDSMQYKWLQDELKSVDRSITPWLLVTIHVPLYNTFAAHQQDPQVHAAKEHLEPLFVDHKVNIVFSGHVHAYQRTGNVAFGEVTPTGPIYITIGMAGQDGAEEFVSAEPEPWIEARDSTQKGFGRLSIYNQTHAYWAIIQTGHSSKRDFNVVQGTEERLPSGPAQDRVAIPNQFFL